MKRWIGVLLAAALLVALVGGALPTAALWIKTSLLTGDVDQNDKVNTTDARLTLQFAAGRIDESALWLDAADVDGNDKVNTTDARLILQYAAERIAEFPVGELYTAERSEPETTPNPNPDEFADHTSGNPIFTNFFTADPSAHVWEDGRLYVYASHDIFPSDGCDLMDQYHVFSTDNMVDWVDEGEILSSDEVEWGRESGGFMWAPDCAYKDGTYYFYYPHPCEEEVNNSWRVGVATSDKPAADFTDQGMMKNPDGTPVGSGEDADGELYSGMIDPCVFEDDDGSFYLAVGGGGKCYIAKIADDMMTLETPMQPIDELEAFHEGSWLFKKDGIYYLMYADGGSETGFDSMRYATATDPMGPYTNRGIILDPVENCSTTHGSIAQYKGNWYLFYHNAAISGNGTLRSVCVDQLYFNEDGTIQKVVQTKKGVEAVGPASDYTEGPGGGLLIGSGDTSAYSVATDHDLTNCTVEEANFGGGRTCVENMHRSGAKVTFTGIDGGTGGKALLTVRYSCGQETDATAKVDTSVGENYFLRLPRTTGWGDYSGIASCLVDLAAGKENVIELNGGMGGFNIQSITVSLLPENLPSERYEAETTPNENPETFATYTSGNPIFTNFFTADPSAHVWQDGRIYVYPSHDIFPAKGCDLMDKYHVFSSDNMVDWVDEGQIMDSSQVMWSNCNGFMWAPDCGYVKETDTYYYFFPHPITNEDGSEWNATWVMGVAKSVGSPTGPFEQLGYVKLADGLVSEEELAATGPFDKQGDRRKSQLTGWFDSSVLADRTARDGKTLGAHGVSGAAVGGYSLIDPCIFINKGKAYLYYGGGSNCFVVELAEDMVTAVTTPKKVEGLADFHEGGWMFENPDTGYYYLMYADNSSGTNQLRYAMATSPLGPFSNDAVLLEPTGCDTSHGSIAQYRGNWYLFYHNCSISGQGNLRSTCVDQLYFNEDGTMQLVQQTTTGVAAVGAPSESTEGPNGSLLIGAGDTSAYSVATTYGLENCTVQGASFNGDKTAVQNMHISGAKATFSGIDGGKGGKALLTVTYAAQGGATTKVEASGDTSGEGYFLKLPKTGGWGDYSGAASCLVDLNPGAENAIVLNGGAGFNIQSITVSLLPENAGS